MTMNPVVYLVRYFGKIHEVVQSAAMQKETGSQRNLKEGMSVVLESMKQRDVAKGPIHKPNLLQVRIVSHDYDLK